VATTVLLYALIQMLQPETIGYGQSLGDGGINHRPNIWRVRERELVAFDCHNTHTHPYCAHTHNHARIFTHTPLTYTHLYAYRTVEAGGEDGS
jgi:hypothetical protein